MMSPWEERRILLGGNAIIMTAMISMPALIDTELRNSVNRIRDICTLEQKLVYALARMAIECPEFHAKVFVGAALHAHAEAAHAWSTRLEELIEEPARTAAIGPGPAEARLTAPRLKSYRNGGLAVLQRHYRHHLDTCIAIADEPSIRIARQRLRDLEEAAAECDRITAQLASSKIEGASGEFVGDSYRAPRRPGRDPAFDSSHEPVDPFAPGVGAREAATQLLHLNLTDLELTTIEICSRFILEGRALG
jgi:hypothetical protein